MENMTSVVTLDGPGYARTLCSAISQARARIWTVQFLIDPRAKPDAGESVLRQLNALAAASARGVDVRVVLPLLDDEGASDLNGPAALFCSRGVSTSGTTYPPRRDPIFTRSTPSSTGTLASSATATGRHKAFAATRS